MSRVNSVQYFSIGLALSTALVTAGCSSYGSLIATRDQASYVVALSEAQKNSYSQTLFALDMESR